MDFRRLRTQVSIVQSAPTMDMRSRNHSRESSEMAQGNLGIEPEVLKAIYGQMARIRAVDKAIQAGLSQGKFMFTYWPMTGQECIPATISQLITSRDYMITTYRGIHDQVAKGVDLVGM